MLPDSEMVYADPIGERALLDDVADDLRLRKPRARSVEGDVAESVQPKFQVHVVSHCPKIPSQRARPLLVRVSVVEHSTIPGARLFRAANREPSRPPQRPI